jgi:hypothetical protein
VNDGDDAVSVAFVALPKSQSHCVAPVEASMKWMVGSLMRATGGSATKPAVGVGSRCTTGMAIVPMQPLAFITLSSTVNKPSVV